MWLRSFAVLTGATGPGRSSLKEEKFILVQNFRGSHHGGRQGTVAGAAQSVVAGSREWDQKQGQVIILYVCVHLPLSPSTASPPLVAFFASQASSEDFTALRAAQACKQVLRRQA